MSKTLVIVESPNKIKKISGYLGKDYIVRASFGHIVDLASGAKAGLGVDIENSFTPKYIQLPDKKDKIASIIDAAKQSDQIYLATDPDREGEAIAWHIHDILKKYKKPIKRIVFNQITKAAILSAIKNPGDLNKDLYDAQQARRVLDRLVGFMVSPFLIKTISPKLSAGRVQSVAVRLIVDRDREIENFKSEEYWDITAQLDKDGNSFSAKYDKKVTNEEVAKKIKKDLDKDSFKVKSVKRQEKKRNPLPPFTTSKLQQAAAARFGFPVKKTMKAAQSLYEAGLITYMRTDSTRLAPEFIQEVMDYLVKNKFDLPEKPNYYATKAAAQDAHEAIRPTDVEKTPKNVYLTDEQLKIYRLIWERAVSCQMLPAIYDTISVVVESSSGHELKANGRTLKYSGWLEIAKDQAKNEEDIDIPNLDKNDKLDLVSPGVKAIRKETKPPPRYGEGSLVKELEKRNIGRPSTYADIVDKIKYRQYVELKNKVYHSTELGKKITDTLVEHFQFLNYTYTADMEQKLDLIADGKLKYIEMLDNFFPPFQKELKAAYNSNEKDYGIVCSQCNGAMRLRHGRFGYFMACSEYPKCKETFSCELVDGKPVKKTNWSKEFVDEKCPDCSSKMVKKDGKFGPFYACSKYPKCKGKRKMPSGIKCDKCSKDMYWTVFDNKPKIACTGYPECRNIKNPPSGVEVPEWINPKDINPPKYKKKYSKVLNAKN